MLEENGPPEDAADNLDAKKQHERFRAFASPIVESRRRHFPDFAKTDWVVQCYGSQDVFERMFPDPFRREEMLQGLVARACERREQLRKVLMRLTTEGLSYQDLEALHYEFPRPDEETLDE